MKLLLKTKKNHNYVTFWQIQIQKVENRAYIVDVISRNKQIFTCNNKICYALWNSAGNPTSQNRIQEVKAGSYMWKIPFVWLFHQFRSTENYT
jgi:hypothetical protein